MFLHIFDVEDFSTYIVTNLSAKCDQWNNFDISEKRYLMSAQNGYLPKVEYTKTSFFYYAIFIFETLRLVFNRGSIVPVTRTCKCFLVLKKVNTLLHVQYIHWWDGCTSTLDICTVVWERMAWYTCITCTIESTQLSL